LLDAHPTAVRLAPRGVLSAVAGAVKLTPLIFGVHYLARRQHRAVITMGVTFVASALIALVLLYEPSVRYWTGALFDVGRIGDPARKISQSITSVLGRAGVPHGVMRMVWPLIALVVAGWAFYVVRCCIDTGRWLHAVVVVGCAGVLISPISWPHHQIWPVLGIPLLLAAPARWAKALALVALPFFLFNHIRFADFVDGVFGEVSRVPGRLLVEGRVILMVAMIAAFSRAALAKAPQERPAAPLAHAET
ncbi:MAG: glycosyltransferase 87 family protein, partial [Dehalococcoidia bacterium]